MDFELSDEQRLLVDSVNNFVKKDSPIERFRKQRDVDPGWSKQIWAQMGELGWLGLPFPESAGGLGTGFIDAALLLERLGTTLVPEPYISSVLLGGMTLCKAGSAAQHAQYLAPMIEGKTTLALAHAERENRHNVANVKTRADKQGNGYLLRGQKTWVLHGDSADHLIVSARTSGEAMDKKGVSLFVLPREQKGVSVKTLKTMDGRRAALIDFDVTLPSEARLGEEDTAAGLLEEVIDLGAAAACAEGAGAIETVCMMTRDYLCDRVQFGAPIGSFQALQHRAVDMFIELQLAKATMLLAALKIGADEGERKHAISAAKVQLASSGLFVTRQGIQLHGGIGVTDEHNVGLYFKRMNVLCALFGDEEYHVQRFSQLSSFEATSIE